MANQGADTRCRTTRSTKLSRVRLLQITVSCEIGLHSDPRGSDHDDVPARSVRYSARNGDASAERCGSESLRGTPAPDRCLERFTGRGEEDVTADAVVFTHDKATTVDAVTYFGLADGGPDGVKAEKATISKLLAGGNADAVWFYAEVTVVSKKTTGGNETSTTRVVEVATVADKWTAVAEGFGVAGALRPSGGNEEIENATGTDGPLAALLASPSSVATQLAPDAIVVGPNDAAQGASARPTLASWKLAMMLFKRAREVRRPTWGFAQANLDHPNTSGSGTDRLAGLVVATLTPGGTWTVVLAQYVSQ